MYIIINAFVHRAQNCAFLSQSPNYLQKIFRMFWMSNYVIALSHNPVNVLILLQVLSGYSAQTGFRKDLKPFQCVSALLGQIEKHFQVLANQFHENFHSKTPSCRTIKFVVIKKLMSPQVTRSRWETIMTQRMHTHTRQHAIFPKQRQTLYFPSKQFVASELKDPIWHSLEWQIGSFRFEATSYCMLSAFALCDYYLQRMVRRRSNSRQ